MEKTSNIEKFINNSEYYSIGTKCYDLIETKKLVINYY